MLVSVANAILMNPIVTAQVRAMQPGPVESPAIDTGADLPSDLGEAHVSEQAAAANESPNSAAAAASEQISQPVNVQTELEGFSALRHAILEAVAGSRQRVWLTSEYLTDGEIVTALYLAQYRKLDVKVLLGRSKAQTPLSRLSYLKQQKVPVWLRPDSFKPGAPTGLLVDDRLLLVDGELNSQATARIFTLTQAPAKRAQQFATDFMTAATLELPAVSRALPMVGRANTGGTAYGSGNGGSYSKITSDGAYRYGRAAEPRPAGVSPKLPKQTKLQERKKAQGLPPETAVP